MSISASACSSSASLIERLRHHLKIEAYSPSIQRWYPTLARHFLDYCDGRRLSMDAVRSVHVAQFLRRQYRLFCQRHGQSLPLSKWRHRYTGAVHMLLRLVHGRWPIAEPPATALEAFHRNVVQDYDRWLCLSNSHPAGMRWSLQRSSSPCRRSSDRCLLNSARSASSAWLYEMKARVMGITVPQGLL